MKHSLRKASALVLALLTALSLAACTAATTPATDGDAASSIPSSAVIAKVGDREITRGELIGEYNSMITIYSYYGMETPATDEEIEDAQDTILNGLVSTKQLLNQAELMGISPLSEEETAEIKSEHDSEVTALWENFYAQAEQNGAEDLDAATTELIDEALTSEGWNMDYEEYKAWLLETMTSERIIENLEAKVKETVTADEEEAKDYYDQLLASQAEQYAASPADYLTERESYDMTGDTPILSVPEGYVRIKVISMQPEGESETDTTEQEAKMADLEAEYGELALTDKLAGKARMAEIEKEYKALKAEVDAALETHLADVRKKAAEAESKLRAGMPFDDALKAYGDDTAYETYDVIGAKGRLMELDNVDDGWAKELHNAVKNLADGAFSGVIEADGALYIVERVGAEDTTPLSYESVHDAVLDLASDEAKETAWSAQQDTWQSDTSNVTYFEENYRDIGKAVG